MWNLYNEPGNSNRGRKSEGLLRATFNWAREVNPEQLLTSAVWGSPNDDLCIEYSDVITFHNYEDLDKLTKLVNNLGTYKYPLICTEWLARTRGSIFETHLPFFCRREIGCFHWGFVNGKTQTHVPWDNTGGDNNAQWFHDVLK